VESATKTTWLAPKQEGGDSGIRVGRLSWAADGTLLPSVLWKKTPICARQQTRIALRDTHYAKN
jgi:hypothetical protein